MKILAIGMIVIILLVSMLKLFNLIYIKKFEKKEVDKSIDLLNKVPSYEQFEKVSRECSVLNSPVRKQGDFMDFIIESIDFSDTGIENKILTLNYGEEYER